MKIEQGKTFHICLDIAGTLKRSNKSLDGLLADDKGREFTGEEVKAFLINVRREHGFTHYSGCDNMNSEGRCAGHINELEQAG